MGHRLSHPQHHKIGAGDMNGRWACASTTPIGAASAPSRNCKAPMSPSVCMQIENANIRAKIQILDGLLARLIAFDCQFGEENEVRARTALACVCDPIYIARKHALIRSQDNAVARAAAAGLRNCACKSRFVAHGTSRPSRHALGVARPVRHAPGVPIIDTLREESRTSVGPVRRKHEHGFEGPLGPIAARCGVWRSAISMLRQRRVNNQARPIRRRADRAANQQSERGNCRAANQSHARTLQLLTLRANPAFPALPLRAPEGRAGACPLGYN